MMGRLAVAGVAALLLAQLAPAPLLGQASGEVPRLKSVNMTGDAAAGERIYLQSCWACHGLSGDGKGPASGGMKPPPTDFSQSRSLKQRSDGELLDAILKAKPRT